MKVNRTILIFSLMFVIAQFAIELNADSAKSISLAGSYSLRAVGYEANYWNPANLHKGVGGFLLLNTNLEVSNNLLSIERYNELNGSFLTEADKDRILNDLAASFRVEGNVTHSLIGFSSNRFALSSTLNVYTQGKISSRYLELIFKGNEFDRHYTFDESDTRGTGLAYADMTIGFSPYTFDVEDYKINTGLSLSYLRGIAILVTDKYAGDFYVSNDGIELNQEMIANTSLGGNGFKAMIGASSQITPTISVGLSFDNLPGLINWNYEVEKRTYSAKADSVYIANLEEEIFHADETYEPIESFKQKLPFISRVGALYQKDRLSLSADWSHAYKHGMIADNTSYIALGCEYYLAKWVPLRCGVNVRTRDKGYSVSYGSGLEIGNFHFNYAIKSHNSPVLSSFSKGLGFAITTELFFK